MNRFKSALLFISGIGAGVVLTFTVFGPQNQAWAGAHNAPVFKDVPTKHPAAAAVAKITKAGIISGYSDDTYRGNDPVTRYELAVVLARFAQYYETSKAPIASASVSIAPAPRWAAESRAYLACNGYVPQTSNLFRDPGTADVSANLLSDTLSTTVDRMIDRSLPVANP